MQVRPAAQRLPQRPQCALLVFVFVSQPSTARSQSLVPVGQLRRHEPSSQCLAAVEQRSPLQRPQEKLLLPRFVQKFVRETPA